MFIHLLSNQFFLRLTLSLSFLHTHTHAHLYTHTYTYTHTHAHTHAYIQTHSGEVLALDLLEEWMGLRIKLEVVSNNSNHLHTLSGIKTNLGPRSNTNTLNSDKNGMTGNNGNNSNNGNGNGNGKNEMSSWVADIGVGKEWEKVVGYWRFSDLIKYGDLGFCNTGIPGARGVFLDLSKYGVPLEIFGGVESGSKVCLSPFFLI